MTGIALTGGRLVDGGGGPPADAAAVLIDGERIVWTGRAADAVIPDGFRRIDTTGHTILPGLVDAHAHVAAVMCGAELQTQDASAFGSFFIDQFLRFGVTAVRDTGSPDTGPEFQLLREGRRDWPRFVGSGPNLDGAPGGPWPGLRIGVDALEHVRIGAELLSEEKRDASR